MVWTCLLYTSQEPAEGTLPDPQLLCRGPDVRTVAGMDEGIVIICFRLQPGYLMGKALILFMLRQKLPGKAQEHVGVGRRLLQQGGRHVAPGLSDGGEDFLKHPFFKPLRTRKPAVYDQAVHVPLQDEGELLHAPGSKGAPFQGSLAVGGQGIAGFRVSQASISCVFIAPAKSAAFKRAGFVLK